MVLRIAVIADGLSLVLRIGRNDNHPPSWCRNINCVVSLLHNRFGFRLHRFLVVRTGTIFIRFVLYGPRPSPIRDLRGRVLNCRWLFNWCCKCSGLRGCLLRLCFDRLRFCWLDDSLRLTTVFYFVLVTNNDRNVTKLNLETHQTNRASSNKRHQNGNYQSPQP